jgi:hypothetical protein
MRLQSYKADGLVSLWNCLVFADRFALGDSFFSYSNVLISGGLRYPRAECLRTRLQKVSMYSKTATPTDPNETITNKFLLGKLRKDLRLDPMYTTL